MAETEERYPAAVSRLHWIYLLLNDDCDSRCGLCDFWKTPQARARQLSPSFVAEIVTPAIHRLRVNTTCVSGGEPTIHPQFSEIVELLGASPSNVTLITSTSNLESHFEAVLPHIDTYLLSIDAADQTTYKNLRGIDLFKNVCRWPRIIRRRRADVLVGVSAVIQRGNLHQVEAIYDLADDIGAHHLLLRVPDLSAAGFGRKGRVSRLTRDAALLDGDQLEMLRTAVERLIEKDKRRRMLIQGEEYVQSIPDRFAPYDADVHHGSFREKRCRVPFTSLTIGPGEELSPCFYLPQRQSIDTCMDNPENCDMLVQVRQRMATDKNFLLSTCVNCSQFEGYRR